MKYFSDVKKSIVRFIGKQWVRFSKFLLVAFFLFLLPSPNKYFEMVPKTQGVKLFAEVDLPPAPLYPVNKTGESAPIVSAEAVLIKDIPSGVVLLGKLSKTRFSPASTTKMMTALVALENYKLDEVVTVKDIEDDGRIMGLVAGEQLTAESLLYGALVHSANDAAYALAQHFPGGVEKFVEKMNEKAKGLSLTETNFTNPVGFDNENHYSTASDLAQIALYGLRNKTFTKIVGTKGITVSDISFTYFHDLKNVNELLGKIPGVTGVKTGFTQTGGEILISEVKKNGQSILIVLLKSSDRFGETTKLIEWVFKNFTWVSVSEVIDATPSL